MKNQKAIDAGQRLLALANAFSTEFIPTVEHITDVNLKKLEDELLVLYIVWLRDECLFDQQFFHDDDVKVLVVRHSPVSYSVCFSDKLSHWAHGIVGDDGKYLTEPKQADLPPRRSLKISLDWDGTVTEDPQAWYMYAKMMRERGHDVYIVTMRFPSECLSIPQVFKDVVSGVYPTSRQPKEAHMLAHGIKIDIWIDDKPQAIFMDAQAAFGGPDEKLTRNTSDVNG